MRFARILLIGSLIWIIPLSSNAQDAFHAKAVASRAGDLYNNPSSPTFGDPNGDVTIVEFYDYQCGYCKASEEGLEKLLNEDSNIKIIYKDFPKLGPLSVAASTITLASQRQGAEKYLWLHQLLMSKDFHLANEDMIYETAGSIVGLDVGKLKQDAADGAIAQQIQNDIDLGRNVGVAVTPSFIVGGRLYPGYASYDNLKQMVDYARQSAQAQ